MTGPITAKPGTDEYQEQFDKQALGAADSILRLWFVRVACGLFSVLYLYFAIDTFGESNTWIEACFFFVYMIFFGVELGSVALFGRSFFLRYMMSGVNRKG